MPLVAGAFVSIVGRLAAIVVRIGGLPGVVLTLAGRVLDLLGAQVGASVRMMATATTQYVEKDGAKRERLDQTPVERIALEDS